MKPCQSMAKDSAMLLKDNLNTSTPKNINFQPFSILILNNWRILHGRDKVENSQYVNFALQRLFIV